MFNEKHVESQAELHTSLLALIILDMNEKNIRESISILRLNNFFPIDKQQINMMIDDFPDFKKSFGYKICNLLNEYKRMTSNMPVKIKNPGLWKKYFPLTSCNIFYRAPKSIYSSEGIGFNQLHQAAFKSMIYKTPENFKQYCKEVELLFLTIGRAWVDNVVVFDKDLYHDLIEQVNQSYEPISQYSPFGWGAWISGARWNGSSIEIFENQINKIGADKFVEFINNRRTGNILIGEINLEIEEIASSCANLSSNVKLSIVDAIKRIPKDKISLDTLCLSMFLLKEEQELRKTSEIIKYLPKLKDSEFPNYVGKETKKQLDRTTAQLEYTWLRIGEFTKIAEIEMGINDVRTEYSKNKLWGKSDYYFNDECSRINFIKKYFSIMDNNDKNLVIKEFFLFLFAKEKKYILRLEITPPLNNRQVNNKIIPLHWKIACLEGIGLLWKYFLKEGTQQKYLKEILKSDKDLISCDLKTIKSYLDSTIDSSLETDGVQRNV